MLLAAAAQAGDSSVESPVVQRLDLMKEVAAYKYLHGLPVEDLEREAVVIEQTADRAREAGLDGEATIPFFSAQIEAAKAIQRCWIERWQAGVDPAPDAAPDLASVIRPWLDEIDTALIGALAEAVASGDRTPANPLPAVECLPPEAGNLLIERLDAVLRTTS